MKELLKKDIRILWNQKFNEENCRFEVADMIVTEFTEDNDPQYLYKEYSHDVGNCLSDWNTWNVAFIIWQLLVEQEFVNNEVKEKAKRELFKIKEIREELNKVRLDV